MQNSYLLKHTLPEPKRPKSLPQPAQWLAGEGAGSWFFIEHSSKDNLYNIKRFSPKGKLECEGLFKIESDKYSLRLNKPYQFVHLSHCAAVHIQQDAYLLKLSRIYDSEFKI